MNGKHFYMILHSDIPSLHTSFQVFHQHPLFSPAGASTGGWISGGSAAGPDQGEGGQKAAYATHILPVETYEVFLCECGSQSYAGNVSLCSARTRPEKPTTLFKEMAVRGPLANSPPLCFSVCSAQSAPSFLVKNDNYFPLWKK